MGIVPTPESDRARFWAKVNKNGPVPAHCPELGPCWLWIGAIHTNGYGAFRLNGKQPQAHIVSYEWHIGPVPYGLKVRHRCDVKACINPRHLLVGTHADNMRDMVERGRTATGLQNGVHLHGLTTLSDDDIRKVFTLAATNAPQAEIAADVGVTQPMVSMILSGRRWRHLLPEGFQVKPPKPRPSNDTIRLVRRLARGGTSQSQIGALVDMSQPAVSRIVNRVAYADVEDYH